MKRFAVLLAIVALIAMPLTALAAEDFQATLTPDAEVPPVTNSEGSGSATATISDDGTEIAYEVSYENMTGDVVAAHIHFGGPDVAGGVILPLAHGPSPFGGTLTEADFTPLDGGPQTFDEALAAIRDGNTYVNLHTAANPGGEIRGQLMPAGDGGTLPPTDSAEGVPFAGLPWMALIAISALAVLLVTTRRFLGRLG